MQHILVAPLLACGPVAAFVRPVLAQSGAVGSVAVTATVATCCAFMAASIGHCNIGNAARSHRQRGRLLVVPRILN